MRRDGLTVKQQEAVILLAAGHTRVETSAMTGVPVRTLHRWTDKPHVAAALAEAEAQVLSEIGRAALALPEQAFRVVEEVLNDTSQAASVRLRAAQIAIEAVLRVRELQIETRLVTLEAQFNATGNGG